MRLRISFVEDVDRLHIVSVAHRAVDADGHRHGIAVLDQRRHVEPDPPFRRWPSPMTLRIAVASIAGVAVRRAAGSHGAAENRPRCRRGQELAAGGRARASSVAFLVTQSHEIGHDILDLLRREDRLAAPVATRAQVSAR